MNDYLSKNTYFLLRHGEADHNVFNKMSDISHDRVSPSHLTKIGREQIVEATEDLMTDNIDYIYASPLTRTMETASIVAKKLGLEIIRDNRLREIDSGVLDGHPIEEYIDFFENKEDKLIKAPERGETLLEVKARVQEFIDEIDDTYKGKNILIISHGDTLWMMEAVLENIDNEDLFQMAYNEPGELRVLGYNN